MKYILLSIVLFNALGALSQVEKEQAARIRANRVASNQAIARHDIDGIAKYWMDDFVQVRGNGTYLCGKDTIIATWKEVFRTNPATVYIRNPAKIIVSSNDSLAWETGNWIGIKSYSKGGSYSAMWHKINNEWKLQAELFVSLY